MNYYVFDRIEKVGGQYYGYKGDESVEVYPLEGETEAQLIDAGFAKCDAPGTETMVVEESAWESIPTASAA